MLYAFWTLFTVNNLKILGLARLKLVFDRCFVKHRLNFVYKTGHNFSGHNIQSRSEELLLLYIVYKAMKDCIVVSCLQGVEY